jgi:putative phosphotransacetylase
MPPADHTIPVALSARHVHLSAAHVEELFGHGYQLTPVVELSQPGQYAARETVEVVGPKRSIPGVRVLGPPRGDTQVEMSVTDGFILGVNIPVKLSGQLDGTPGVHLIGPRGAVRLTRGCICAVRHIHATPDDAKVLGVVDGQKVYVRFPGPRGMIFDEVVVRVSDKFRTELHLDTDEGNAAGIQAGDRVEVVTSVCRDLCGREDCLIAPDTDNGQMRPFCDFTSKGVSIR